MEPEDIFKKRNLSKIDFEYEELVGRNFSNTNLKNVNLKNRDRCNSFSHPKLSRCLFFLIQFTALTIVRRRSAEAQQSGRERRAPRGSDIENENEPTKHTRILIEWANANRKRLHRRKSNRNWTPPSRVRFAITRNRSPRSWTFSSTKGWWSARCADRNTRARSMIYQPRSTCIRIGSTRANG